MIAPLKRRQINNRLSNFLDDSFVRTCRPNPKVELHTLETSSSHSRGTEELNDGHQKFQNLAKLKSHLEIFLHRSEETIITNNPSTTWLSTSFHTSDPSPLK